MARPISMLSFLSSLAIYTFPFILIFDLPYFPLQAGAKCYFPDGKTIAAQDTPCSTEGNATCCGQGFACLSNNICMLTSYVAGAGSGQSTYVRGSCTDPNWNDPNCPQFCISAPHDDAQSGGEGLKKCDGTTKDMYFCADNNTANVDCGAERNVVVFQGQPSTVTIIGVKATSLSTSSSTSPSTSSSDTATSSSITTDPGVLSPTTMATPTPSTPAPASNVPNYSAAIGAGVGVPLGIIAIGFLVFIFFRYRRSKRREDLVSSTAALEPMRSPLSRNSGVYHDAKWAQQIGPIELGRENNSPQELSAGTPRHSILTPIRDV